MNNKKRLNKIKNICLYDDFMDKKNKKIEKELNENKNVIEVNHKSYQEIRNSFIPMAKLFSDSVVGPRPPENNTNRHQKRGTHSIEHVEWVTLWNIKFHEEMDRLMKESGVYS